MKPIRQIVAGLAVAAMLLGSASASGDQAVRASSDQLVQAAAIGAKVPAACKGKGEVGFVERIVKQLAINKSFAKISRMKFTPVSDEGTELAKYSFAYTPLKSNVRFCAGFTRKFVMGHGSPGAPRWFRPLPRGGTKEGKTTVQLTSRVYFIRLTEGK